MLPPPPQSRQQRPVRTGGRVVYSVPGHISRKGGVWWRPWQPGCCAGLASVTVVASLQLPRPPATHHNCLHRFLGSEPSWPAVTRCGAAGSRWPDLAPAPATPHLNIYCTRAGVSVVWQASAGAGSSAAQLGGVHSAVEPGPPFSRDTGSVAGDVLAGTRTGGLYSGNPTEDRMKQFRVPVTGSGFLQADRVQEAIRSLEGTVSQSWWFGAIQIYQQADVTVFHFKLKYSSFNISG